MLSPPAISTSWKLRPELPSTLMRKGEGLPPSRSMSTRTPSLAGLRAVKRLVTVPMVVKTVSKKRLSWVNTSSTEPESVNNSSLRQPANSAPKAKGRRKWTGFKARKDGATVPLRRGPAIIVPVQGESLRSTPCAPHASIGVSDPQSLFLPGMPSVTRRSLHLPPPSAGRSSAFSREDPHESRHPSGILPRSDLQGHEQ
jgi:hypothetical protein